MRIFVLLLVAYTSSNAFAQQVLPILEYYPSCDYTIVDKPEAEVKVKLTVNGYLDGQTIERTFMRAKTRLLEKMPFRENSALILVGKSIRISNNLERQLVNSERSDSYFMKLKAELVELCDPLPDRPKKVAPIASDGRKNIGLTTIGKANSHTFSFDLTTASGVKHLPISDFLVSHASGVFGAKLGDSVAAVIARFGDPSINLQFSDGATLLAFGRDTWFLFTDDKLIRVSNLNKYLNQEIINLVPFDDRFDTSKWYFLTDNNEQLRRGETGLVTKEGEQSSFIVFTKNDTVIEFGIEKLLKQSSFDSRYEITGFNYYHKNDAEIQPRLVAQQESLYTVINKLVAANQTADVLPLSKLSATPLGRLRGSKNSSYLIFDNQLVMRTTRESVDKITLYESVFNKNTLLPTRYNEKLLGVHVGMSADRVLSADLGEVFEYGDTIEITAPNYTNNLFLYGTDTDRLVYQSEVLFY